MPVGKVQMGQNPAPPGLQACLTHLRVTALSSRFSAGNNLASVRIRPVLFIARHSATVCTSNTFCR